MTSARPDHSVLPLEQQLSSKLARFLTGGFALLFISMAVLGWIRLRYGFSMMDEGMYMVDGWRLSAGDRLFPDSAVNAVMMYSAFNALVFKWHPAITLLGFRELQLVLALAALAVFGAAIYRWTRRPWLILLTLSVFAFTGLTVAGMNGSLSYYTYPHLFFVLHLSALLFALDSRRARWRDALFVAAGIFLWAIGFSLLPLALTMIIPLAVRLAIRALGWRDEFSYRELLLVMVPGLVLWGIFLAVYGSEFLPAIIDDFRYIKEGGLEGGFDPVPSQYIAVTAIFVAILVAASHLALRAFFAIGAAATVLMFFVIDTNLFGHVTPFWRGWFPWQMWFCALLIVAIAALGGHLVFCRRRRIPLGQEHLLLLMLVLPSGILALVFGQFTAAGVLTTTYAAFPVCMALTLFTVMRLEKLRAGEGAAALAVTALLLPFYYHLARADWEFTSFDLPPKYLTRVISEGFGAGIHTSEFYQRIVGWMTKTAQVYSHEDDFAIIMDQSPMGYMIIRRRPALNHSFTGWGISASLRRESLATMLRQGREPKIAYRFIRAPMIVPAPQAAGSFTMGDRFYYAPDDPLLLYVKNRMQYRGTYQGNGEPLIELYVRD